MRQEIEKSARGPVVQNGDSGEQSFQFDEDFIGFSGHFPGYPILPAVLQTLLAQSVVEQLVGEPLQFLALERAKFTKQVGPGDHINVSVVCKDKQGQLSCSAELSVAKKRAASFTLLLGKGSEK